MAEEAIHEKSAVSILLLIRKIYRYMFNDDMLFTV